MKMIFALMTLLTSFSAMALDFSCKEQLASGRTSHAQISSWPSLMMAVGTSSYCTPGTGNSGSCSSGTSEMIADPYEVCYHNMAKGDCTITETANSVTASCRDGIVALFQMDASNNGQISCSENGVIRKTWKIGTCELVD